MGFINEKENCIFETEGAWGNGNKKLLCLNTASWRTERPVMNLETCKRCGTCFVYCPTQCISAAENMANYEITLDYCKGCGVCATECPHDSIQMISEGEFGDE